MSSFPLNCGVYSVVLEFCSSIDLNVDRSSDVGEVVDDPDVSIIGCPVFCQLELDVLEIETCVSTTPDPTTF